MKKNILIATAYLNSGGVEVSLIRFLKELSKNKDINIDLLLLKKTGIYVNDIPKNVNIVEVEFDKEIYDYDNGKRFINKCKYSDMFQFITYRLYLRILLLFDKWSKYYETILKHTLPIQKKYDIAIDWHGYGHLISSIVGEKVNANKKVMWIHDEKNEWLTKIKKWISNYDKFFCVSKSCEKIFLEKYPKLNGKTDVFYNLSDYENVRKKALKEMPIKYSKKMLNIVTVGRLEWQKGYDIAIKTAIILKEKKVDFCWYIIGGGSLYDSLQKTIKENNLEENFKLLGLQKNPYPFIKNADIYVQTSRHEGYGIAIMEAKILGIPCVATKLGCIKEQITDGVNGHLCELNEKDFANKIINISQNTKKIETIKRNLEKESFDYTKEFKKLYELINYKKQ